MAGLPLPLGSESQKIHERFCVILEECIENNMSKDEILRHVHDKYLIPLQDTNRVWNHLERTNPDLFIAYNERIRERKAQPLWNSPNVEKYAAAESPQEANVVHPSTQAGPSTAANANQNLQTSQQQPVIPSFECFGPHPSATGSLKRKRVGGGENEEGEKLKENESGGNEEAHNKLRDNEEGNDVRNAEE